MGTLKSARKVQQRGNVFKVTKSPGVFPLTIQLQDATEYPRLVFEHEVDENDLAPQGFRGDVRVEFSNGEVFPVYFYEPQAVQEELLARSKWGFGRFVSEPGLVIVPEITVAAMKAVVAELIEIGYFSHLKPV